MISINAYSTLFTSIDSIDCFLWSGTGRKEQAIVGLYWVSNIEKNIENYFKKTEDAMRTPVECPVTHANLKGVVVG